MLIAMRVLITGSALAGVLAVGPASTVTAMPAVAVRSEGLGAVACPRVSECWAVGSLGTTTATRVLIERWNGSRWRVAASPGAALSDTFLGGVSCASASSCWAVGAAALGKTKDRPIAEHWNGRKWSLTVLAEPAGTANAELRAVSCVDSGRCWAAGAINPGGPIARPLVAHWNGKRWSLARVAGAAGTILNAGVVPP